MTGTPAFHLLCSVFSIFRLLSSRKEQGRGDCCAACSVFSIFLPAIFSSSLQSPDVIPTRNASQTQTSFLVLLPLVASVASWMPFAVVASLSQPHAQGLQAPHGRRDVVPGGVPPAQRGRGGPRGLLHQLHRPQVAAAGLVLLFVFLLLLVVVRCCFVGRSWY